jgi:hypothetical protein
VFLELLEVLVLLCELLLELQELLLLTHSDGVVLVGLLTLRESITMPKPISTPPGRLGTREETHPEAAPVLRGAPVSPPAMARVVVEKAARDRRAERSAGRTAWTNDCRYMIVDCGWCAMRGGREPGFVS